eukprot:894321-Pleurochrysis_carterae.AAC.2
MATGSGPWNEGPRAKKGEKWREMTMARAWRRRDGLLLSAWLLGDCTLAQSCSTMRCSRHTRRRSFFSVVG